MRNVVVLLAAALAACASTKSQEVPPPAPAVAVQEAPKAVPATVKVPEAPPPVEAAKTVVAPGSLYFDFDSSELKPEARDELSKFFDAIREAKGMAVRIEGNCDERGTQEYNLALGQRRADAAKKYLVDLGYPAEKISTISYGEERPRAPGHDEAAWRENRRDDVIPIPATGPVSQR